MDDELQKLAQAALLRGWQAVVYQIDGTHQRLFVLAIAGDIDMQKALDPICDLLFAAGHTPGLTTASPYGVQIVDSPESGDEQPKPDNPA